MTDRKLWHACGLDEATRGVKPKASGWYTIRSPLRADKRPSFDCRPDDTDGGAWRDHSTDESGSLYELAQRLGVEAPTSTPQIMGWREWCHRRHLDPDRIAAEFKIVEVKQGLIRFCTPCGVDRLRGLSTGPSEPRWARRGGRACAYGRTGEPGDLVYLVEGEPSVWACWQSGVLAVCGLVGATQDISALIPALRDRVVRIAYDADEAGEKGAEKARATLRGAGIDCEIVRLDGPKGYDVDDLHRKVGDDGLAGALRALDRPIIPEGWAVEAGALVRIVDDSKRAAVCECPIAVVNCGVDVDTGLHTWRIKWRSHVLDIPRADLASSRTLTPWSGRGLPVDQHTAPELVRYLTAYEEANRSRIPRHRSASSTGWYNGAFLAGTIRHGDAPVYAAGDPGTDPGIEALAPRGSFDTWIGAMRHAVQSPGVRLAMCGALASTLTQWLEIDAACIDIAGTTSQGKTSALRVALSCLGDPEPLTRTWDTTRIAVERLAARSRGITLALDDTMRARRIEDVQGIVYDITSGKSRLRGSAGGGMQASPPSHSWIISTGEGPLVEAARGAGGLRARVLTVRDPVWGAVGQDMGRQVRGIVATVREHHGHALPRFVELLRSSNRDELRRRHAEWCEVYSAQCYARWADHPVGDRICMHLASLAVVGELLHRATGLHDADNWVDRDIALSIMSTGATADRSREALEEAVTGAQMQADRLASPGATQMPPGGWIGRVTWGDHGPESLALDAGWLRDHLRRQGYAADTVLPAWRERGWVECESSTRYTKQVRIGHGRVRCVVLTEKGLTRALGAGSNDGPAAHGLPV